MVITWWETEQIPDHILGVKPSLRRRARLLWIDIKWGAVDQELASPARAVALPHLRPPARAHSHRARLPIHVNAARQPLP